MKIFQIVMLFIWNGVFCNGQTNVQQYEYWFDDHYGTMSNIKLTPSTTFNLKQALQTDNLPAGLHSLQIRFKDNSNKWSVPSVHYFYKYPIRRAVGENKIQQCEYWFDDLHDLKVSMLINPSTTYNQSLSLNTNNLPAGLHSLQIRFKDNINKWSVPNVLFFYKYPERQAIGKNKIVEYRYWYDDNLSTIIQAEVTPLSPLQLESIVLTKPYESTPENYEFYPDPSNGASVVYHKQVLFNIQFKDSKGKWSSTVTENVQLPHRHDVVFENLNSNEIFKKEYPTVDTIHFYQMIAQEGDSLVFKTDCELDIDLYDPDGGLLMSVSKKESVKDNGFHATKDGAYYALVHGFSSLVDQTYEINYINYPKYCIIKYNRKVLENNGVDTILFKGNGFHSGVTFALRNGTNQIESKFVNCNYKTTCMACFEMIKASPGFYDINIKYGDTTIVIANGLEIVDSDIYTVLHGKKTMPTQGSHPFAGVYEYKNLILDDETELLSYGISELVIKVAGEMRIGKEVAIRVRNGFYSGQPLHKVSNVTDLNIQSFSIYDGLGYSLYPNLYGKGGDGGNGGRGGNGTQYTLPVFYVIYEGLAGGGGGGGCGGFGGGLHGFGGPGGVHVGIGYDGVNGTNATDSEGGNGGPGGAAIKATQYNAQPTFGGYNGGRTTIGSSGASMTACLGYGGAGGGGNGGSGGNGDLALIWGNPSYCGYGAGGGGGGGYGGGILVITANSILVDEASKPMLLALGQKGGKGGYGLINATYGGNGGNGEGGLVIVNTPNPSIADFVFSESSYGSNENGEKGGHGEVVGDSKVLFNVNAINTSNNEMYRSESMAQVNYDAKTETLFVHLNDDQQVQIYCYLLNMNGQVLYSNQITTSESIGMRGLPSGVYLLRLNSQKNSEVMKFYK